MTSFKSWLRELKENMTTLYDTKWDDYGVTLRPCELVRRLFKFKYTYLLPYMDEQQTAFKLTIRPPRGMSGEEVILYSWAIRKEEQEGKYSAETLGSGGNAVKMRPNKKHYADIVTDLIVYPAKYSICFSLNKIGETNKKPEKRIGILTLKDRTDTYTRFLFFVVTLVVSLISLIVSVIAIVKSGT